MRGGGGSRGGGGFRGGSRISRGSRRHYGRRRGFYGGYGYGYGFGFFNPFWILIVVFMIGIGVIFGISAAIGGSFSTSDDLEPGEMMIINADSYISASVEGGTITTHFFDARPSTSGTITYPFTDSRTVPSSDFVYWEDSFSSGSTITLTWTADTEIDFYLVVGSSDFDKWKEGEATQQFVQSGLGDTFTYTTTSDTKVFFAFENSSFNSKLVTVDFDIEVPVFDTSTAEASVAGSFTDRDFDSKYIVVENTGSSSTSFSVELNKRFGFLPVFLILLVLYILGLYWLGKRLFGNRKKNKSLMRQHQPQQYVQAPTSMVQQQQQPPSKSTYVQRPTPKYCQNCGTSILPDSKFCGACGHRF